MALIVLVVFTLNTVNETTAQLLNLSGSTRWSKILRSHKTVLSTLLVNVFGSYQIDLNAKDLKLI